MENYDIITVDTGNICNKGDGIRYNAKIIIYLIKILVNFIHFHVKEWYNNVKLNNKR